MKRWRRMMLLLLALLLPTPLLAGATAADSRETSSRLDEVRKKIGELRSRLEGARDRQTRLREELRSSEIAIGEANRALREIEQQQRAKNAELRALGQRHEQARSELGRHRSALEQQIRASYAMGQQGHLKLILNQQDPAALGRMLTWYNYFNSARAEQIAEVSEALQQIAALEQEIAGEQQALERLHGEQSRQLEALEASRRNRGQVLAKIDAEIQTAEQSLETLLEDERSLAELVENLRAALARVPPEPSDHAPFSTLKGKLPWPVEGRIVARYGTHRRAESLPWRGIVIDAEEGREVKAVHGGRVVFSDWMRGFGLLIIIDHGHGYMSLYGYNQSLYKGVGDPVRQGETIATVGSSGGRDRPGLYFEIRHNGKPDNPSQWVRASAR